MPGDRAGDGGALGGRGVVAAEQVLGRAAVQIGGGRLGRGVEQHGQVGAVAGCRTR